MERSYLNPELRRLVTQITNIRKVTARILGFNDQSRLLERQLLIHNKKYPSSSAIKRMNA